MGKIKFKKPDIKGCFGKLKSLKWADMKNGIRAMKKRQAEKEAAYRNSRFAQKMQKLYPYMNRYSLILHGIWAIAINFLIEAMSRHSVVAAISYSRVSTKAFLYNAFMIFVTFSIVSMQAACVCPLHPQLSLAASGADQWADAFQKGYAV